MKNPKLVGRERRKYAFEPELLVIMLKQMTVDVLSQKNIVLHFQVKLEHVKVKYRYQISVN